MNVGLRRVSPLKLASFGGAAILALIGIGLHPPSGGSGRQVPSPAVSTDGATAAPIPVNSDDAVPADQASSSGPTRRPGPTKAAGKGAGRASAKPQDGGAAGTGGGAEGGGAENGGGAEDGDGPPAGGGSGAGGGSAVQTVNCPSVKDRLPAVPAAAAAEVNQNLALLRQQIADANARLAELAVDPVDDPNFVQNTVLGPLRDNRVATIDRIAIAIGRYTTRPSNLAELAPCRLNS